MGAVGREHVGKSPEKQQVSGPRGAKSGAVGHAIAAEAAEVLKTWPLLPPAVRAGILAMIRAVPAANERGVASPAPAAAALSVPANSRTFRGAEPHGTIRTPGPNGSFK